MMRNQETSANEGIEHVIIGLTCIEPR